MPHTHYFENLFIPYGDETLIVTGNATWETTNEINDVTGVIETELRNFYYPQFISAKITDLHRVTELDTELQGYTEADFMHFQKLAVDELNKDTELCDWLSR